MTERDQKRGIRIETVKEFSEQFRIHRKALNEITTGVQSNPNLHSLSSHFVNLVTGDEIRGSVLADIGCGSGRFSKVLLDFEPRLIHCVEPSSGFGDAEKNLSVSIGAGVVQMHHDTVENVQLSGIDYAFMVGVLHHLIDPIESLRNVYRMLRPGASLLIWVYGSEQSPIMASAIRYMRRFLGKFPDRLLEAFCSLFVALLNCHSLVVRLLPKNAPLRNYFVGRWRTYSFSYKKLIIFDQLNPSVATFYTVENLRRTLTEAGFERIIINVLEGSFGLAARCERGQPNPG